MVIIFILGLGGPSDIVIDILDGALFPRMIPQPLRGRFWRWARFWWLLGPARRVCCSVRGLSGGILVGAIVPDGRRITDPAVCAWPWPSRRNGGRFRWRLWLWRLLDHHFHARDVGFGVAGVVLVAALAVVIGIVGDETRLIVVVDRFCPVRRRCWFLHHGGDVCAPFRGGIPTLSTLRGGGCGRLVYHGPSTLGDFLPRG